MQSSELFTEGMEERSRVEESARLGVTQKLEAETSNKAKGVIEEIEVEHAELIPAVPPQT